MGYSALSAFLNDGKLPQPTLEDLAKRLVWFDLELQTVFWKDDFPKLTGEQLDILSALIARLLREQCDLAYKRGQADKEREIAGDLVKLYEAQEATVQPRNDPDTPV